MEVESDDLELVRNTDIDLPEQVLPECDQEGRFTDALDHDPDDHDPDDHDPDDHDPGACESADLVERRGQVALAVEWLSIFEDKAWFLVGMFNAEFYKRNVICDSTDLDSRIHGSDDIDWFSHYLTCGIDQDISPSPAFDTAFVRETLSAIRDSGDGQDPVGRGQVAGELPVMLDWLAHGFDSVSGHPWFDEKHYLSTYPDISEGVPNAYAHFATHGIGEERLPNKCMSDWSVLVRRHWPGFRVDPIMMFSAVPAGHAEAFMTADVQSDLKSIFMPSLYREQIGADEDVGDDALYAHFMLTGACDDNRPTVIFNREFYLSELRHLRPRVEEAALARDRADTDADEDKNIHPFASTSAFLHWYFCGMESGVVPTPLFDTDFYVQSHRDIRENWCRHPFMHFSINGVREKFRKFSTFFDTHYYLGQIEGQSIPDGPLLDYTERGQFEGLLPAPGLDVEIVGGLPSLQTSVLETVAVLLKEKVSFRHRDAVRDMISRAEVIEPQIMRPYGAMRINFAPIFHPEVDVMRTMRLVREDLSKDQCRNIILMPHCRMAGSARIAGRFAAEMRRLTSADDVMIITTDKSVFDRPEWFPEDVDVLDLSKHLDSISHENKVRVLLDVVRGLRPQRLININSNLGWHLTTKFGKQLSRWADLYVYLFCWDVDSKGNKGGYPIQWFLPTFDYCKAVFTDSTALRDELRDRYCIGANRGEKILTLHTPAENSEVNYEQAMVDRSACPGVRRVFWAGRFDRQKRVDVLLAVARRMSDVEFWVWGRSVLNDSEVTLVDPPDNVRLMGVYSRIDDVPMASCDCFLYTSGWDGLPTVIIEVGSRSIPIVASDVGGISDLINENTGWPIADYTNADRYVDAIREVFAHPERARAKAARCRSLTLDVCSDERYSRSVASTMNLEDERQISRTFGSV